MNPITNGYPDHLTIDGKVYRFRTGFRYWMEISECIEDGLVSDMETIWSVYDLSGLEPSGDFTADFKAINTFLAGGEIRKGKSEKTFDFEQDAGLIVASFQSQYGIDLTDPKTKMHWWRFLDLFSGLGNDTPIMRVVEIRTAELPNGRDEATRKRRDALRKAKREFRLKPRNLEQALQRDKEIWE